MMGVNALATLMKLTLCRKLQRPPKNITKPNHLRLSKEPLKNRIQTDQPHHINYSLAAPPASPLGVAAAAVAPPPPPPPPPPPQAANLPKPVEISSWACQAKNKATRYRFLLERCFGMILGGLNLQRPVWEFCKRDAFQMLRKAPLG